MAGLLFGAWQFASVEQRLESFAFGVLFLGGFVESFANLSVVLLVLRNALAQSFAVIVTFFLALARVADGAGDLVVFCDLRVLRLELFHVAWSCVSTTGEGRCQRQASNCNTNLLTH